jgi:hypothetical protein
VELRSLTPILGAILATAFFPQRWSVPAHVGTNKTPLGRQDFDIVEGVKWAQVAQSIHMLSKTVRQELTYG